ncbi:petrobactin biosynthesis protein AsbA [Halobacillus andaensis]|uniref:Petrobactin biosynthesis protein AsbA n=1 Tax=Halobacillus andaensis TaxID=1176239 RepID=A0A917B963_HALAA|nr:IucA/IucC family protein [Halobacillus andaensis]MBP2005510.1 siderophore synthetase component [Halobacillus andaensis]GGF32057.1 petrobactin biosynthesis protein AsbA [Halobacillus andaensis]
MKNYKVLAEEATMQSFFNCYLRETNNFQLTNQSVSNEEGLILETELPGQKVTIAAPVKYWSQTGRHRFDFPLFLKNHQSTVKLDYITLVSTILKELSLENGREGAEDELMLRVILSCQKIRDYLGRRESDADHLLEADFEYIDAEQSLLLGHLMHPTPKSRQGLTEREDHLYSPEYKGEFQLHYFKAKNEVIVQDSSLERSASQEVINQLMAEPAVDNDWLRKTLEHGYSLLPVHPLQAKDMLENKEVKELMEKGDLFYLGPIGSPYKATSSFRTVYNKHSDYMFKFSLPIKITNSLRGNLQKELDRGVEISRLLNTEFGEIVSRNFPSFHIIEDPAYIKLNVKNSKAAYDAVLRQNPYKDKNSNDVSLIAGLCQDHVYERSSRLFSIITHLSQQEGRSTDEVSKDWFEKYLSLSFKPILWLFENYGLALEAHQQNSLVKLSKGYPEAFYYRDNQGYYFSEDKAYKLKQHLSALNKSSDTICTSDVAVERLIYYFFFNHIFGLINSFGSNGLVSEEVLLDVLRKSLQQHNESNPLIHSLLHEDKLPCKANLLTRFHDMDELQGSLETQSVYTLVSNPIVSRVGSYEA